MQCLSLILALGITVEAAAADSSPETYGPSVRMSGVYFTNFENSVFIECTGENECKDWAAKEGAWANCRPSACQDLAARLEQLNGGPNVSATFAVTFVGKRNKARHTKRFLNDRESTILIEQILDFRLIGRSE